MKIFRFVKKMFLIGLTILLDFTNVSSLNAIPLSCIQMNNQQCKTIPEVINVSRNSPVFYPLALKQVNVVVIVIILMIPTQKYVFLML